MKTRRILAVISGVAALHGCAYVVTFDRSKIDAGEVDASVPFEPSGTSDASEAQSVADASSDAPDAKSDATDARTDATDAKNDAPDAKGDAAADARLDAADAADAAD